jgi:hypothetical protein
MLNGYAEYKKLTFINNKSKMMKKILIGVVIVTTFKIVSTTRAFPTKAQAMKSNNGNVGNLDGILSGSSKKVVVTSIPQLGERGSFFSRFVYPTEGVAPVTDIARNGDVLTASKKSAEAPSTIGVTKTPGTQELRTVSQLDSIFPPVVKNIYTNKA